MNISVEKAKEIREDIGATHLILFVMGPDGTENVSTHGATEQQAHEAAAFGNGWKKAMGWPAELCQSIPQQRAEWQRKTATEIDAEILRLLENKKRNLVNQQALLQTMVEYPARYTDLERELTLMKRRAEDYETRIHALEWVLNVTPKEEAGQ